MKKVYVYKLKSDGKQDIVLTCFLMDGVVKMEGDPTIMDNLLNVGLRDYSSQNKNNLFPKDGIKFMEQMKYNFRSPYLLASEVIED